MGKLFENLGKLMMYVGVLMNPYFVEYFFSPDRNIVTKSIIIKILLLQLTIFCCGFFIIRREEITLKKKDPLL